MMKVGDLPPGIRGLELGLPAMLTAQGPCNCCLDEELDVPFAERVVAFSIHLYGFNCSRSASYVVAERA